MYTLMLKKNVLFFFIFNVEPVHNGFNCSNSWLGYGRYCYLFQKLYSPRLNWAKALLLCQSYGGSLLSVEDQAENDFIKDQIKIDNHYQIFNPYLIGLNDIKTEGTFEWADNTTARFFGWNIGEPNNQGNEDCVEINVNGWNDILCDSNLDSFICKRRGQDIDECAGSSMYCNLTNSVCINTIGSYTCACKSGWVLGKNNQSCVGVLPDTISLSLIVEKNQLQNCSYITTVTIFSGTDIQSIVDFGDGTAITNITNIAATGVNGFTYTISHIYSVCSEYTITAYASINNNKAAAVVSKSDNVTVFCLLSPLKVITKPIVSQNSYVQLSVNKYIILSVYQDEGSYRNYSIDWGDGTYSYNNQEAGNLNSYSPVSFQLEHSYKTENKYTILVSSKNCLQNQSSVIQVHVKNCSVPDISFYYGTIFNPMAIFRSVGKNLTAFVESISLLCKIENFTFEWSLTSKATKPTVTQGSLFKQQVSYPVIKNSLHFGLYTLLLKYVYGAVTTVYTAYLNVIFLPLHMEIDSGFFNSVSYIKKIRNESYYQNFSISAEVSNDPDDPNVGVQDITFRWRCKVSSNFSEARVVMSNFNSLNLSYRGDTCFNETWVTIPSTNQYINFSTQHFLEGMNYHIEVCGTKYAGKDIYLNNQNKTGCYVQELLIISRSAPTISLKCISNCDAKLNFKDRVIYSFDCEDCGSRRLVANWTIINDMGNFPLELSFPNATTTGFSTPSLVINKDILHESKNYTFTLVVGYADSINRVEFKFTKSTCSKPSPGVCYARPAEGYALETNFMIECSEWTDLDGFLSYMFYYDNSQSQQMTLSSTTTIDYPMLNAATTHQPSLMNVMLGPGDENNNFTIRIIAKVGGKYQAYTEYNMYIKVYMKNKIVNITNLLNGINLNDTQYLSNVVQAVGTFTNINSMNYYNNPSSFDKNYFSRLQKSRTQMISLINNAPLSDLSSFKSISDALVITSRYPLEVTPQAQYLAGCNLTIRLAELLTKKNLKAYGADRFDSMTQSFLNSISNLLQASLNNSELGINPSMPEYQKTTLTQTAKTITSDQREGKLNLISKLSKSMENYFMAAQSYKVPGENETVGETKLFKFVLKKTFSVNLINSSIGSSDGGFSFPDAKDMFNESLENSQILINNVRMKDIIYTMDINQSQNILSESQSLSFFGPDGRPIKVSSSSKPINISIKNFPEKMNGTNVSLSMPNDAYRVMLPLESGCNMLLKFVFQNDQNNLTNLIVYIQYGKIATQLDYDIMLNISSKHGVVMERNNAKAYLVVASDGNVNVSSFRKLTRNQDARLLDDGTIVLWNFFKSTYSLLNKSELNLMFLYSGPMPPKKLDLNPYTFDKAEYSGTFDYEIKSFCVECNYWNEDANRWMSNGCQVDIYSTSFLMTKCHCFHLTTFGGLFVAPTPLLIYPISRLKTGYVLLVAVALVILLWVLGLMFTRRMDKKDLSKIGVCSLIDNEPNNKYLYQVAVNTGSRRNAGTSSNIFFIVFGDKSDSGVRYLNNPERKCFQRASFDVFIMTTHSTLGDLDFIRIWHDNTGGGWYLKNIIITDLQTEKNFIFIGHQWIAVDRGLCKLEIVLPVVPAEESTKSAVVLKNSISPNLFNEHLWFSIFFGSPRSNFTKCQKLTIGVSLIFTSMMVSTMYYDKKSQAEPALENKYSFGFTWTQIFVVLVSTCIECLFYLLFVKLFCFKRQLHLTIDSANSSSIDKSREGVLSTQNGANVLNFKNKCNTIEAEKFKNNKINYLHYLQLYMAWFVCVGNILGCSIIVLWYGMLFGNTKSLKWLTSIIIIFVIDIFLVEPVKIYFTIMIMIFNKNKFGDDKQTSQIEMQGKRLASDNNWLYNPKNKLNNFDKTELQMQPLDYSTVENMRKLRTKRLKMQATLSELVLHIFNACLVFVIGYSAHDSFTFYQTSNVQELFNLKVRSLANPHPTEVFNQIRSSKDFWPWMEDFFLPIVYPEPWYNISDFYKNTDKKDFPGKLFLNDLTSKIVNGIRIRQIRVKPSSCTKHKSIAKVITEDCLSPYKSLLEETSCFNFNWTISNQNNCPDNPLTTLWRYQTWQELDGYPYATDLNTYYGGGYVIEIFPKWNNKAIIDQAKIFKWLDRQTRALIIDFALFNAATNSFSMVTMILEFPGSGGAIPTYSVLTFQLYSTTKFGLHIFFIFVIIIFITRECRFFYQNGCSYLFMFWNIVDVAMILFSITAVGFFFYKDYLAKLLLQRLPSKKPQAFINFQFASYWDLMYVNIVSMIIFCITLKFIKLLQFNRRISMISYTLQTAWYPLSMVGICFLIVLASFLFSSVIVFGAFMEEYKTYFEATVSVVSLLLGKFSFSQYKNVNSVLGPIFFFGFNVIVIWIIMNMLISILNDSYNFARADPEYQNNDHEIIDFIFDNFKEYMFDWLGHISKKRELKIKYQCKKNSQLNEKKVELKEEKKLNKRYIFTKKSMKKEIDTSRTFESRNTLVDEIFLKYDKLLNESELDTAAKDKQDQVLKKKFINCVNLVNKIAIKLQ